ncbi:MAG TPA: glycosyltransferase family 4 protein [Cyclobacteriaceae bacterium]|nr:glycosyltransferase family 4 protein [Cyclobacteriaceae bacterium]
MKILFIVPYPLAKSPSQRFRFEQYFGILRKANHLIRIQSFLNDHGWCILYRPGKHFSKALSLLRGFIKRFFLLFQVPFFDFVFIHREAAPVGPPVFEWIIAKIFRKKIIYDFDDAIWLTDNTNESSLIKIFRWRSKVSAVCRWSYNVSCGNQFLQAFARKYNSSTFHNPTTIDTEKNHNLDLYRKPEKGNNIVIGWTGSHSTLKYLGEIETVLQKIERDFPHVSFVVIANQKPAIKLASLKFIPWKEETEIPDLLTLDIGLMPLPDDEWSKGKCGFKALQYMALEIPAIASPVGVNTKIIRNSVNGFLCVSDQEWFEALAALINDKTLRERIGKEGRKTVVENYSVASNTEDFLKLFN